MKKFLHLNFLVVLLTFILGTSLNVKAQEKSDLIGTWYLNQTVTEYFTFIPEMSGIYDRTEVEEGKGEYWVFTETTVTVYDSADIMNEKPTDYTYDVQTGDLSIKNFLTYKVKSLTPTSLILYLESSDGNFGQKITMEFLKENNNDEPDDPVNPDEPEENLPTGMFRVNGIYYNILSSSTNEVEVVTYNYKHYSGDIIIPESVSYNGIKYTVISIGKEAFMYSENLQYVTLPNSIKSIEEDAFFRSGLIGIEFGENLISIGDFAFDNCINLIKVDIPDSVQELGNGVFEDCVNLQSVVIGNSVAEIPKWAFEECEKLQSVIIGESVTKIGEQAFAMCYHLESIIIPDNVITIGESAFEECTRMKSAIIGNSVELIGPYAFRECYNLEEVKMGNSIKVIGDEAFDECKRLKNIEIPNSVVNIEEMAFIDCISLETVIIGSSVETIGDWAFENCKNLTSLTSYAINPPTCGEDVFNKVDKESCVLYVPKESLEDYKSANQWKDFYNIVSIGDDTENDDNSSVDSLEGYKDGTAIIYDLSGRKLYDVKDLKDLTPGFYIINGKKYLLK